MRPVTLPDYIRQLWKYNTDELILQVGASYTALHKSRVPEVSVVIPAYNEEKTILTTLLSIARNQTDKAVEIIVVNNNSTDRTEELVLATGVKCLRESQPGPTFARTKGLHESTAKYVMNADADSIYPPTWIDQMIPPLERDNGIAITYGRFAFLPGEGGSRFAFFLYENMADVLRWRKRFKEEAMNVYGCNSAFRREQCLQVNGYEHPPGTNEDGYLALKLREKGFGRLHYVPDNKALVWTVDRHLQNDGGLVKAMWKRVKGVM